jgi:hypothetical protein
MEIFLTVEKEASGDLNLLNKRIIICNEIVRAWIYIVNVFSLNVTYGI